MSMRRMFGKVGGIKKEVQWTRKKEDQVFEASDHVI